MSADLPALTPDLVPLATSYLSTLLLLGVGVVLFVFLIQRPLKKQQAAQRQLQDSLAEGGRVMLSGGMFGTLRHLGDKQAVVELAPGLEVTVLRQAISRTVSADEEEFEYADDATDVDEQDYLGESGAYEPGSEVDPATVPEADQQSSDGDDPDRPSSI